MPTSRTRVLEVLAPPDGTTRYVDQVVHDLGADVTVQYFSWRTALLGRYDVLHLHWPEHLTSSPRPWRRRASLALTTALQARLRATSTPVLRTLHNTAPHEELTPAQARRLAVWDDLTTECVRINTVTPPTGRPTHTILHGDYRTRFAGLPHAAPVPGRIAYVGLVRPYKGVEDLLARHGELAGPDVTLRVVGKPVDAAVARQVRARAAADPRVTARLEFVDDPALVEEVTSAELVALPYRVMGNSGVLLVALSLGRPVLVPRTELNTAIADEVGPGWVHLHDGPLRAEHLTAALAAGIPTTPPALAGRSWDVVGRRHTEVLTGLHHRHRDRRTVSYWCRGQDDNLGDVVLRRRMLAALQPLGECHALVGAASAGFVDAMGFGPDDVLHTSRAGWYRHALGAALRGRWVLALNPGEVVCDPKHALDHALLLPLIALGRLRGAQVLQLGRGLRGAAQPWLAPIRATAALSTAVVWRDAESAAVVGRGTVAPDWAFDEPRTAPVPDGPRRTLAVSFRGDRPPVPDAQLRDLARAACALGLRPVLYAQVRRDVPANRAAAAVLDAAFLDWPDDVDHAAQEARVRALLSSAAAVVSDRLHALVMGLTEGAVPVGATTYPDRKLDRHLAAAGLEHVVAHLDRDPGTGDAPALGEHLQTTLARREALLRAAGCARSAVRRLDALAATTTPRSTPAPPPTTHDEVVR